MIFTQPLYGKVLRGEKTQTRRLVQAGDLATKYRTGMRKAVQKGRGVHGEAHIILTDVRREALDRKTCALCDGPSQWNACTACGGTGIQPRLTIHDAKAEGFRTTLDFKIYWLGLHDKTWIARREKLVADEAAEPYTDDELLARFNERHAHRQVWVLTFQLDTAEQPRFLMQGSPLTEGGKARVMSNRQRTPGKAKAREVTGPEEHGYSGSPARAMPHEVEPIDARTQDKFSQEGHQGFVAREKQREIDREHLAAEERLRQVRIDARAQGVDIGHLEAAILQRVRAAERKVHQRKAAA